MQILKKMLKQFAVYWPPKEHYNEDGSSKFEGPEEIKVRWEDIQIQYLDDKARVQLSRARVYVGIDARVGGMLWLGKMDDLEFFTDPTKNAKAYKIRMYNKIPTLKGTKFLRECYL